jgi:pilus assembly protein CpaE
MFMQLTCVIVDADENNRHELGQFLAGHGITPLASYGNTEQLTTHLGKTDKPQLVIVNLDPGAMDNLRHIAPLIRQFPDVSFFVMSQVLDPNLLMEAMHVGVKEFIPLPIAELKFKNALERLASAHGMSHKGKVINIIPSIGGVGSTTIACNVAAVLAQKSKTVLVDLDLVRGGVATYFDARPRYTIADLAASGENIDRQVLDNALTVHAKSGLSILARPEMPEDTQRITSGGFQRLLSVLTRMFDYVVVDSMMSIDPVYASTINVSTMNLVVMQLNVPSAKNTERFIGTLRRSGLESSKIKVVVNRFVKKGWDIDPEEVERSLGLKLAWMVPNDFKNAIAAINYGEPVVLRAPRCEMSQSITELTEFISARDGELSKAA